MYKVHIVPGWAEGNWHFKQFTRSSDKFGLERHAAEADIIVAHSSGVYSLPKLKPNHIVVLMDPPYWPGRSIQSRVIRHVILDAPKQIKNYGLFFWLRLRLWNLVFLSFEPWRHIKLWRSIRKTLRLSLAAKKAIMIRDDRDAYCGPEIKNYLKQYPSIEFIEIEGLHETCWAHPEPYLEAITRLMRV